jgi:carboxylesterase type B
MTPLAVAVGAAAGGKPGAQLEALRKLPATQVAEIENRLIATQFPGYNPNSPVIDGWVLPQSPAKAYASGAIQKVDLLVGLNAREWAAFRVGAEAAQKKSGQPAPKPEFGKQIKLMQNETRPLYGNWTDITVATYMAKIILHGAPAVDQTTNDIVMACPMGAEAALVTSAGALSVLCPAQARQTLAHSTRLNCLTSSTTFKPELSIGCHSLQLTTSYRT